VQQIRLINSYVQSLQFERGLALGTVAKYADDLDKFSVYVESRGQTFESLGRADCQDWLKSRYGLDSAKTANGRLNLYKQFYDFLMREGVVSESPFTAIRFAKTGEQDIGAVMSVELVGRLLDQIINVRDRAMFELMYASGLRVNELVNLKLRNIHVKERFVQVVGKGGVERIVPVGEIALAFITDYIENHRSSCVTRRSDFYLFLTQRGSKMGSQMSTTAFYQMMMRYMAKAGLPKIYSPHSLRHAFATHLMDAGVDILTISKMLGHASVNTTDIYTHIAKDHLKALIEKHHPRGTEYVKFTRFA
jgi:integrase/recombinase XerD